ncbi:MULTISPECIES: hypothetical protein [unclassified Pseudomonas]|uniref:hypothetical protein n=1 Tax=unclassified Pseudomonas TaxID=196821 RepID=UPI0015A8314D|nr:MULTISPECIES: hypothetical protein [unclassified Pseudomonas]MDN4545890.1 hypothetical protein [Pseudomonas sp. C32]
MNKLTNPSTQTVRGMAVRRDLAAGASISTSLLVLIRVKHTDRNDMYLLTKDNAYHLRDNSYKRCSWWLDRAFTQPLCRCWVFWLYLIYRQKRKLL